MDKYRRACKKQLAFLERYNHWFNDNGREWKQIFKACPRILKTIKPFQQQLDRERPQGLITKNTIKKILFKEMKHLTCHKRLMWRRYRNNQRFNIFCIAVYRKTYVDVCFARHKILEYLHG